MKQFYKIGELSRLSGLSRRTIDYYTTMGLIYPESRTEGNYRLYNNETLERINRIEFLKKEKYTLEEIKQTLDEWDEAALNPLMTEKIAQIQVHLKQLEREVKEISPFISQMKPKQAKNVFKSLTPQTAACMEAIYLLFGKGPFI